MTDWRSWQARRDAGRPSAQQLQDAARGKSRQRRHQFDGILQKVYSRISSKAQLGWTRVLYQVPPFFVGMPPYDVGDCVRYLTRALRRAGYLCEAFDSVVYISWDASEKSRPDSNRG